MTPLEKRREWVRYLDVAMYPAQGLTTILRLEGEEMLSGVLQDLGLKSSLDLVRWLRSKER